MKVSFTRISYPSSRNAYFDERNFSSRVILQKLKIDRDILFVHPQIGALTIYSSNAHAIFPKAVNGQIFLSVWGPQKYCSEWQNVSKRTVSSIRSHSTRFWTQIGHLNFFFFNWTKLVAVHNRLCLNALHHGTHRIECHDVWTL